MGRTRGGLTTKIHAVVDAEGRPIKLALSPGQDHDCSKALPLLDDLGNGSTLLADRASDTDAIRALADQCSNLGPNPDALRSTIQRVLTFPVRKMALEIHPLAMFELGIGIYQLIAEAGAQHVVFFEHSESIQQV